jgi:hypothetical protein
LSARLARPPLNVPTSGPIIQRPLALPPM